MTDYYPLLARALDALPDRSPALRRAVYERARGALIGQLRSLDPPVPESDIELERKSLDAAIDRLEAVYAEAAAPAPPPAAPPPAPLPEMPPPQAEALPEPEPPPRRDPEFAPPPEAQPEPADAPRDAAPVIPFVPTVRRPRGEEPPPPAAELSSPSEPDPSPEAAPLPEDGQPSAPANEDSEPGAPADPNGRQRPRLAVVAPRQGRTRLLRNLFVGAVLAAVIGLIAVAAFLLRDRPSELPPQAEETATEAEAPDAKFSDRVGGEKAEPPAARPSAPPTAAGSDVAVAQSAILYEENPADTQSQPGTFQGRAIWRTEAVNGEQGEPLQTAVRATVEYPEAGLTLTMTIRRNRDATLPASHTIELAFTNFGPGAKRAVQNIGLIQGKDEETARGSPVSGLPVRVRDNLFLIGLSSLKNDVDRNTDLLLHRNWFDLAVSYASGTRALMTFEKGSAGTQAMQSAFDRWRD